MQHIGMSSVMRCSFPGNAGTVIRKGNVSKILAPENIMFGKMAKSPGRPAESSPRTISPKLSILVKPEQTISKTCILGWSKPHQSFVQIREINVPGNIMFGKLRNRKSANNYPGQEFSGSQYATRGYCWGTPHMNRFFHASVGK